jgi:hypothetical protein
LVVISSRQQRHVTVLDVEASPITESDSLPEPQHARRSAERDEGPPFLRRHGLGLLMALATTIMMAWGLGHIAFWLDEGATALALQRTWPRLWTLMNGADAPLVPYYAGLKVFSGTVRHVIPAAASHPEILLRLPSAVATVIAVWALTSWLNRICLTRLAVCSGVLLLLIGGLSRYGQEARPYALALCAAVVCTIVWTMLINDRRPRWIVIYALCVAVMVALHSLTIGLVAAHLVAAVAAPESGRRGLALLRTLAGATVGLLLVSPLMFTSGRNGQGASSYPPLDWAHASSVFVRLFNYSDHPFLGVGPVILLAAVGLTRVNSTDYRFIARLAAAWAFVPLGVLVLAVLVKPNLLFGRYVLYVIPAWAILGGLGIITLMDLARRAIARLPIRSAPALATVVAAALAVALVAGTAADESWTQAVIRTAGGHGEDIRPALATAKRPEYAALPIVVSSQLGASEISAYDRSLEHRLALLKAQRTEATIWPKVKSSSARGLVLRDHTRLILLLRSRGIPGCTMTVPIAPAAQINRCMSATLRKYGYRVVRVEPSGRGWAFAIVQRP